MLINAVDTGPGKYKHGGSVSEYFHGITLDGGCDEECGTVDEMGWFGLIDHRDDPITIRRTNATGRNPDIKGIVAAIVSEDSQGFVTVTTYQDYGTARADFTVIMDDQGETVDLA